MKEANFKLFKLTFVILLLLFVFHLINNIIAVNLNNAPLVYDASRNYNTAKTYFFDSDLNSHHPPLITFLSLPIFKFFGPSQKAVSFGIGIYSLFVVLFATYLLGKELYSKGVGLLSAFILSSLPIIFGHSRTCMGDLALAGWVALSILLMMQPEAFVSLKRIVPLGIVIGLGLLTSVSYPLYVFGPFLYIIIKKADRNRKTYLNLFLIFLIAFSVCLFWYLSNAVKTLDKYVGMGQFRLEREILYIPFNYTLDTLLRDWFGAVCVIVFFLALVRKNKIRQPWRPLFLIWIIVPYVLLSFLEFKNPRFLIPVLPALTIVVSFFILNIERVFYRKAMITFIVFLGIAQTIFISYSPFAKKIYEFLNPFDEWGFQCFGLLQPVKQDWKSVEICNTISTIAPDAQTKIIFIKARPFIIDGLRQECEFDILLSRFELSCMNSTRLDLREEDFLFSKLDEADVVIEVENSPRGEEIYENENKLGELFRESVHKFSFVNSISLPDSSRLKIYKSKKLP